MTEQIISNIVLSFLGIPGKGKSMAVATIAAIDYYYQGGEVYSNLEIKVNGIKISKDIKTIHDIEKLGFHHDKGCIVLDEFGINNNARRSLSSANAAFNEFLSLGRKKNLDILWAAQLSRQTDVIYREMSNYIFEMDRKISSDKKSIIFKITVNTHHGGNMNYQSTYWIDFVEMQRLWGISYSTLESSKIKDTTKKAKTIDKKKLVEVPNI